MSDFFIYFRYERGIVCLLHENSGRKEGASTLAPHRKEEEASLLLLLLPCVSIHTQLCAKQDVTSHPGQF